MITLPPYNCSPVALCSVCHCALCLSLRHHILCIPTQYLPCPYMLCPTIPSMCCYAPLSLCFDVLICFSMFPMSLLCSPLYGSWTIFYLFLQVFIEKVFPCPWVSIPFYKKLCISTCSCFLYSPMLQYPHMFLHVSLVPTCYSMSSIFPFVPNVPRQIVSIRYPNLFILIFLNCPLSKLYEQITRFADFPTGSGSQPYVLLKFVSMIFILSYTGNIPM